MLQLNNSLEFVPFCQNNNDNDTQTHIRLCVSFTYISLISRISYEFPKMKSFPICKFRHKEHTY